MVSGGAGRARQAWRVLQRDGARGLAQRVSRVAYHRLSAADLEFMLDVEDVADSRGLELAVPARRPARGTPLTVGWIFVPPGPGSGGHTTMFRMLEAVEAAGHRCVIYLYDRYDGDLARHESVIRRYWPRVRAEVRSVDDGLAPLDAYVATAWQTAHVLASRADVPTRRLYLVQDFEPYFYPRGSEYALAEDTYRFGFRCVTVGRMLADLLSREYGVRADVAEFGCDTDVYRLTEPDAAKRDGVVFYARPRVARRGFEVGMLALHDFHRRQPHRTIHVFGDASVRLPFPAVNHGSLTPARLSELYNTCRAGIAMSFTNLSLVPVEMLACGAVPVLSGMARQLSDLDNPHLRWAEPTPRRIADELEAIVTSAEPDPAEVAGSVKSGAGWGGAGDTMVAAVEDEVYGPN